MKTLRIVGWLMFLTGSSCAQQYVISTVAGGVPIPTPAAASSATIGRPQFIVADAADNAYFTSGNCVYKLDENGMITRIAGNSPVGYSGDGGPATAAQMTSPSGIAIDAQGNLFVSDGSNRIRRISISGIITTIAGIGSGGFSGDGGPATTAQLQNPQGLAIDASGNLFIADAFNNRVREVSTAGIISTVAGTGTAGFSGDGGPAANAQLSAPVGLALDPSGNLLIADTGNNRVRKVSANGTITTLAGNGVPGFAGDLGAAASAQLSSPYGLSVDASGNVFIADSANSRIRLVSNGTISTFAGNGTAGLSGDGGAAGSAQLNVARGIGLDGSGNLLVADSGNYRVRKISSGGIIATAARTGDGSFSGDNGPAVTAQLYNPVQVAADASGNLFIADRNNNRVRKISAGGTITTVAGSGSYGFAGDGGAAISAQIAGPYGVAVDGSGNLYFSDQGNNRVRKVAANGIITTLAGNGTAGFAGDGGQAVNAQLNGPCKVAVDASGNVFIADASNNRVRKVSVNGTITTVAGNGIAGFSGDGGLAVNAALNLPQGIALDGAGNLFIADPLNFRVRKVSPAGIIATVAGDGVAGFSGDGGLATSAQFAYPGDVAVDGAGNLFILDPYTQRVRLVSTSGRVATLAGNGNPGYAGDGGPGTGSELDDSDGIATDASGNLYVADSGNDSIRKLTLTNQSVVVSAVIDAGSESAVPVSPGKIVTIYGGGLGPSAGALAAPANGSFGTQLSGTTVTVNGVAAPVIYASDGQVIAIVPYGISGSTASVTVAYEGQVSQAFSAPLAASSPGIFTSNQTGAGQAAAVNAVEGTLNNAASPVKIGSYISLYLTGEGQTTPAGVDGKLGALPVPAPNLLVSATIDGGPALVQYAGGVFGAVAGLLQVNLQVPASVRPGGYVPVVVSVGNASTVDGAVWIAVSN